MRRAILIDRVIERVCSELGVSFDELASFHRYQRITLAREAIAYIGRRVTLASYPDIAYATGKRRENHSSAMGWEDRMKRRIEAGETYNIGGEIRKVADIVAMLEETIVTGTQARLAGVPVALV